MSFPPVFVVVLNHASSVNVCGPVRLVAELTRPFTPPNSTAVSDVVEMAPGWPFVVPPKYVPERPLPLASLAVLPDVSPRRQYNEGKSDFTWSANDPLTPLTTTDVDAADLTEFVPSLVITLYVCVDPGARPVSLPTVVGIAHGLDVMFHVLSGVEPPDGTSVYVRSLSSRSDVPVTTTLTSPGSTLATLGAGAFVGVVVSGP